MNIDRIGRRGFEAPNVILGQFGEQPGRASVSVFAARRRARIVLFSGGCVLAGVLLARGLDHDSSTSPAVTAVPHVAFVEQDGLAPLLAFRPPEGEREPLRYIARIREATGDRKDELVYGDIDGTALFLRVTLQKVESISAGPSLFVELAKQSAELGAAVVRATSPQFYDTDRGRMEWADMTLSGPTGLRACLGFRFPPIDGSGLSGVACGGQASPLDAAALACLIGRLAPTQAGLAAGLGEALKSDPARGLACRRDVG